jgi:hypothetical protein
MNPEMAKASKNYPFSSEKNMQKPKKKANFKTINFLAVLTLWEENSFKIRSLP